MTILFFTVFSVWLFFFFDSILLFVVCIVLYFSPSGWSDHGISQARILEWVAISFPTVHGKGVLLISIKVDFVSRNLAILVVICSFIFPIAPKSHLQTMAVLILIFHIISHPMVIFLS